VLPRLVLDYLRAAAAREWVRQGTSGRGEDICHDPAWVAPSRWFATQSKSHEHRDNAGVEGSRPSERQCQG
jgi:hypothetical protein